jgi:hypothetical protein
MRLLSIDPGLHGLGCGLFEDGVLLVGWYAACPGIGRGPARWRAVVEAGLEPVRGYHLDTVVVEQMQVYHRATREDPADLLEVQGVAGAIAGWVAPGTELVGYLPRVWKGAVPQLTYANRVDAYLRHRGWADALLACPVRRRHDMLHGVGIGLHHLGLVVGGRTGWGRGASRVAHREQVEGVEDVRPGGGGLGVARFGSFE